jgi:hypothetical protein
MKKATMKMACRVRMIIMSRRWVVALDAMTLI